MATKTTRYFLITLGGNILLRAMLFLWYPPQTYPDSGDYRRAAEGIRTATWTEANGKRTPVYPLLIAIAADNERTVYVIQLMMGISISMMLFSVILSATGNPVAAMIGGFAYSLHPGLLLFEANILTETACTFFVVATLWLYQRYQQRGLRITAIFASTASVLAGLTRPMVLSLPVLLFLLDRMRHVGNSFDWKTAWFHWILFITLVGALITLNGLTVGNYGVTTSVGYNLINHAGDFIEEAGPEYDNIKVIYIPARERQRSLTHSQSMTIATVADTLKKTLGTNATGLSEQLTRASLSAIVHAPVSYLVSVISAGIEFWRPATRYNRFTDTGIGQVVLYVFNRVIVILYFAFLIIVGMSGRRKALYSNSTGIVVSFSVLLVLMTWLVSSLLDIGENSRYKIPCEPLIFIVVIIVGFHLYEHYRGESIKRNEAAP